MQEEKMMSSHGFGFRYARIAILSITIAVFAFSLLPTAAQSAIPIGVDEIKIGELSPESSEIDYSVVAHAGETLDIRLERVTGDIVPLFSVLRGTESLGIWYAYTHGSVLDNFSGGLIKFAADGEYTIRVSARNPSEASGKFFLAVNKTVPPTPLAVGERAEGEMVGGETKVFAFQSIPQSSVQATVDIKGGAAGVIIRVKNSRGDILGSFEPPIEQGLFNIPQGQKDYTLEIVNGSTGSVIQYAVNLTVLGSSTSTVELGADGLPLMPNAGACIVATRSATPVNIRPEPSLDRPAFTVMSPTNVYPVTARNQDGSWYQIQDNGRFGWVAAAVTRLGGNCESLLTQ